MEHEQVMKDQVAYGTIHEHKRALRLFENFIGGSFVLSRILPHHAEAFVADRLASREVSVGTVNKWIRTLHGIFNLAIEPRGYLAEGQNPFAKIKERKITENPIGYVKQSQFLIILVSLNWLCIICFFRDGNVRNSDGEFTKWQMHRKQTQSSVNPGGRRA